MSELKLRRYERTDGEQIIALINLVQSHVPFTRERWAWEYPNCVGGRARVWVAECEGKIIGHAGRLRFDCFIDGEQEGIFLWVDAMVHPDFRRRNLHAEISDCMLREFKNCGIPLSIVFPNERSIRQLEKDNWTNVARTPHLAVDADGYDSRPLPAGYEVRHLDRFGPESEGLLASLRSTFRFALMRCPTYLNWRYVDKPDDTYLPFIVVQDKRVCGYMVYKLFDKPGEPRRSHIVDIWTEPLDREAMAALIRHASALAADAGSVELSTWMFPHAPCAPVLADHGFSSRPRDRFFFANVSDRWDLGDAVGDPANWYLTMGDSDVY